MKEPSTKRATRRLPAALAGATLGIAALTGGVLFAGPAASAEAGPAVADEAGETVEAPADDLAELEADWADFDACLVDQGVLTAEELEAMYADGEYDDEYEDGEWDEDFEDIDDEWIDAGAFAFIESDSASTFVEFGEGDGTVTIEKVGDDIVVSTDGDVSAESFDLADLESEDYDDYDESEEFEGLPEEIEAEMEAWEAAFDACDSLAPDLGDVDDELFDDDEVYDDEVLDDDVYDDEAELVDEVEQP